MCFKPPQSKADAIFDVQFGRPMWKTARDRPLSRVEPLGPKHYFGSPAYLCFVCFLFVFVVHALCFDFVCFVPCLLLYFVCQRKRRVLEKQLHHSFPLPEVRQRNGGHRGQVPDEHLAGPVPHRKHGGGWLRQDCAGGCLWPSKRHSAARCGWVPTHVQPL